MCHTSKLHKIQYLPRHFKFKIQNLKSVKSAQHFFDSKYLVTELNNSFHTPLKMCARSRSVHLIYLYNHVHKICVREKYLKNRTRHSHKYLLEPAQHFLKTGVPLPIFTLIGQFGVADYVPHISFSKFGQEVAQIRISKFKFQQHNSRSLIMCHAFVF